MARNGQKIFDTDTHVGPSMAILEGYMSAKDKSRLEPLKEFRFVVEEPTRAVTYRMGQRKYRRKLGEVGETTPTSAGINPGLEVAYMGRVPDPASEEDPAARIGDLDLEGVDVNLMLPSGWFGSFSDTSDIELESAVYNAYNRWMNDYCSAFPERLGGVIPLSARDIDSSLKEIERCSGQRWAWGIFPVVPYGMPLDHPDLEPFWAAAQRHDLSICIHTFTVMPPYAPGGLDTWDNIFLQRSAAHVWCGERNMAAIIGAGILDRYPEVRLGVLEAGHGWLPQWVTRLDEHAKRATEMLPDLKMAPSEYVQSGRYFQSIEISEGWAVTKAVLDILGENILMYASDYPHFESWFPKSVDRILEWDMSTEQANRIFWENPIVFYKRAGF